MAASVQSVVVKVRDLISDSMTPYRWEDSTMFDWINEAVATLFENHPEFFYTSSIVVAPPNEIGDLNHSIDATITGIKIIVNYTCYRCLARDNEDPETLAQAKQFLEIYSVGI